MRDIHAIPAYGRDYKSKAAVLADWQAGKDFRDSMTGQYLSSRDFPADKPHPEVWVRYQRQTKITRIL